MTRSKDMGRSPDRPTGSTAGLKASGDLRSVLWAGRETRPHPEKHVARKLIFRGFWRPVPGK
jgi:hypothetical protein